MSVPPIFDAGQNRLPGQRSAFLAEGPLSGRVTSNCSRLYTPQFDVDSLDARVAELVDAADSDSYKLSPRGEILEVKPVKLGEDPEL